MSRVYACVWVAFIRSWWFNVYFCHESDNNFCLTYLLWFRSSAWGQGHVEKPLANGDFAEQGARAPRVGVAMTNECQRPMSNVCRHTASRSCHHRHILIAHCRHQHEQSKKVERIPTEWRRNPNSSSIRKKTKQNTNETNWKRFMNYSNVSTVCEVIDFIANRGSHSGFVLCERIPMSIKFIGPSHCSLVREHMLQYTSHRIRRFFCMNFCRAVPSLLS